MMHKAWSSIEDVPYCFSRSSVKFQGQTGQKTSILTQIGRFRTVTLVWIHWWLWNDAQSLKQHRRDTLLFFKVIRQNARSHGTKIADFDPNWAFPIYLSIYLMVYSLHHNVLPTLQSIPLMTNGPLYPITQDSSCHGQHIMPRNPWSFPMTSSA